MINKPREVVKSQARHQEDVVRKMTMHLDAKINEHLGKYPDEEGKHNITISMREYSDFDYFFDLLSEHVQKEAEEAGWKMNEMTQKTGYITVVLELLADDNELTLLEELREAERKEFHRVSAMRKANR